MNPNLAPPTGATLVDEWDNVGAAFRAFDGPEWRIKHATDHGRRVDIVVTVVGLQYADGRAECEIIIDCPDTPIITPAEARKLGRALIAAADSAEGVTCAPHPAGNGKVGLSGSHDDSSALGQGHGKGTSSTVLLAGHAAPVRGREKYD